MITAAMHRSFPPLQRRWPPPATLPERADLAVLAVLAARPDLSIPWFEDDGRPPVIVITIATMRVRRFSTCCYESTSNARCRRPSGRSGS
ncbi:hypothetical protein WS71_06250 [Burkholderia mayonis]|uniref:Uncharacterized protein n=1 Tax=Burkholderia mayonis TaxID=1385591 RepID=A0A1B4FTF1_9BURK|nr:hypothetical protein WS71_06250 [Burkholderia mayonis]KVE58970.1 hypothetical protein WS71_00860 [Burkholderia mayonis]